MVENTILFEIGTEDMPARFVLPAIRQMEKLMEEALGQARITFDSIKSFATPRRLALIVEKTASHQTPILLEYRGPAKDIAYNAEGQPTKAAEGFARSKNASSDDLIIKKIKGKEFVCLEIADEGRATRELLPDILSDVISKLYFPKTMRWGAGDYRFVRPLHWIVALWGKDIIPFEVAGIKSGNISMGHRFRRNKIEINKPESYEQILADNLVLADHRQRRQIILATIEKIAAAHNGVPVYDEDLLEEVTFLVEYPTALEGIYDEKYLSLPEEVLITVMIKHQRFFPVRGQDGLLPIFINVYSGQSGNAELVCKGNEKILKGRFEDALFFFTEDGKITLAEHADKLKKITFLEDLGTMEDKVQRLIKIVEGIVDKFNWGDAAKSKALASARLSKADLTTLMVGEFPELQGTVGNYYALKDGVDTDIALALAEQYLPRFAEDDLPESPIGLILSLADKLDNIFAAFYTGNKPSGSQDPLALRRQGLAAVKILANLDKELDIFWLFREIARVYSTQNIDRLDENNEIREFFQDRVRRYMLEEGFRHDMVEALLKGNYSGLKAGLAKAEALQALRLDKAFKNLVQAYTRIENILKGRASYDAVDEKLWQEEAEERLFAAAGRIKELADNWEEQEKYIDLFTTLAELAEPLEGFFEDILVMAEDEKIKINRLALLQMIKNILYRGVDLAQLVMD